METSPLTQELYSIDWAARFEQFQQYEKLNFTDLNAVLKKIEQTIEKNLENKKGLDSVDSLRKRLNDAENNSNEWHHLSMLVNLRVIRLALNKNLTSTAALGAIQIMDHMWKASEITHNSNSKKENASPNPAKAQNVKKNSKPVADSAVSKKAPASR